MRLAISMAVLFSGVSCGGDEAVKTVEVSGSDFAFEGLPAQIESGPRIFTFTNTGREDHELAIAELNPGQTVESALANPAESRKFLRARGQLFAPAGQPAPRTLRVELNTGNYVVVCFVPSASDSQPHYFKGMKATFEVR